MVHLYAVGADRNIEPFVDIDEIALADKLAAVLRDDGIQEFLLGNTQRKLQGLIIAGIHSPVEDFNRPGGILVEYALGGNVVAFGETEHGNDVLAENSLVFSRNGIRTVRIVTITKTVLQGDGSTLAVKQTQKSQLASECEVDRLGSKLTKEQGKIWEHLLAIHYATL